MKTKLALLLLATICLMGCENKTSQSVKSESVVASDSAVADSVLEEEAESTFEELIVSSNFSGRAEHSILKLSRTIADLEGCEKVNSNHIAEAYEFRKNEGGLDICF